MLNFSRHIGAKKVVAVSALMGLSLFTHAPVSQAAEDVTLKAGPFSRKVTVDSLKSYASTGQASGSLGSVLKVVKAEQRKSLTELLQARLPYGVVEADKLLKSPIGDQVLKQVATATILPGDDEGKSETLALRSAIIGAAAQDKNISFITLLEKYPTPNLTVDIFKLSKILSNPALSVLLRR